MTRALTIAAATVALTLAALAGISLVLVHGVDWRA